MVLETIYVTRHGFRAHWTVDARTGAYTSLVPSPTQIAGDVPLVSHGHEQARQLAAHVVVVLDDDPPVHRIYSSPFTRCLQTLAPVVQRLREDRGWQGEVRGENGLGEWFGPAPFPHPRPASSEVLHELFPFYSPTYQSILTPPLTGESLDALHDRVAVTLSRLIADLDADPTSPTSVLLCTHAATLIALGRVLTGVMPLAPETDDFKAFTCGLSVFVRRRRRREREGEEEDDDDAEDRMATATTAAAVMTKDVVEWRDGRGVAGGWDCVRNGDCSFLEGGAERGWKFGDP